ncbi:P-loop containing nucleoside triphosphate hydrolase protein [Radiomyces spectabilis]|uniref:P-loop containing nucleoside triphosphate hydrolase protein n=1 Tax=Radiomyces spectabilis TaxID=64574 RepID=UPI002220A433|nr:P-loop containing nucleoside triphosphate hydrolase protein [Radiomyces spectabilis]KAI8365190.1 P-loop containing nucleoside triphosphate hydrolase protein [Radiomyces spectabilis]
MRSQSYQLYLLHSQLKRRSCTLARLPCSSTVQLYNRQVHTQCKAALHRWNNSLLWQGPVATTATMSQWKSANFARCYHSIDYRAGGLGGGDNLRGAASIGAPGGPAGPSDQAVPTDAAYLSDPRTIVKHLNDYVIGQEHAKKILAVAIFNHYNRVRANLSRQQQRKQQREGYPEAGEERHHTEHHHPTLPQEYYPSNNSPIQGVGNDLVPAERLLVYGSQRRAWLNPPTQASGSTRPSSDPVHAPPPFTLQEPYDDLPVHDKSNVLLIGPTGSGKTLLAKTLAHILQVPFSMSDATPFTQAGYVGEDVELVIQRLLQACDYDVKKAETGIVFIDEIDKISRRSDSLSASRDVSGEGVQQSLLRMLEGTVINITDKSGGGSGQNKRGGVPGGGALGGGAGGSGKGETYAVDTSNILFILSGAFIGLEKTVSDRLAKGSMGFDATLRSSNDKDDDDTHVLSMVEPIDLVKYGLIPEFVGRLPVLASVKNLDVDDLVRVLTEPKNSLLKQYESLFGLSQIELCLSKNALREIAKLALEKKTGARGLRRIMENLLLDPMYDAPGTPITQVVIDSKVVSKKKAPIYLRQDQQGLAEKIIAEDDGTSDASSSLDQDMAEHQQMTHI